MVKRQKYTCCKKHQNNGSLLVVVMYYVYNKFLAKILEFVSEFSVPIFFLSIFVFWVSSWQHVGCQSLCFPSIAKLYYELWIDRSAPQFQSCAGGSMRKTSRKSVSVDLFCSFSNIPKSKSCRPDPENKRLDTAFNFF